MMISMSLLAAAICGSVTSFLSCAVYPKCDTATTISAPFCLSKAAVSLAAWIGSWNITPLHDSEGTRLSGLPFKAKNHILYLHYLIVGDLEG